MATIKINNVTALTESGGVITLDSAVTGIPAAGVTGVLPVGVTGGSGLNAVNTGLVHIITASVGTGANTGSTFTNFWSSSYKTYWIILRDIGHGHSGTAELRIQYHTSGGAEAGAAYEAVIAGWGSNSVVYSVAQEGSTSLKICPNLGEETGRQYNAQFTMNGMSGVDTYTTICGSCAWYHGSNYIVSGALAGHYSGNYATDFVGFQLLLNNGVFNSGSVSIFGIKES